MTFLSYLISGVSLGSIYAIIALGYTMVYGIAKMLNFAHGDVIMVGAYISFCTTSYLGLSPFISVLFSIIVCTALGIVVERLAYQAPAEGAFPGRTHYSHRRILLSAECSPAYMGIQPQNLFFRSRELVPEAF